MIWINCDHPNYFSDISEEIRLFLPDAEISLLTRDSSLEADDLVMQIFLEYSESLLLVHSSVIFHERSADDSARVPDPSPLIVKRYEKRTLKNCVYRLLKELYGYSPPWGSLTGIRPTKLFRSLDDGGLDAKHVLASDFDVSEDKISLASEICRIQKPFLSVPSERSADVYIHIPFCVSRCLYCSFPSSVLKAGSTVLDEYLDYLEKDIRQGFSILHDLSFRTDCVYIGGGTPTILNESQLYRLLEITRSCYPPNSLKEFTLEAGRPDTITGEKLTIMKEFGVDRISINPQTMNDTTLERIGRRHTVKDIMEAYEKAVRTGFQTINMDLIAGLPGEKPSDFVRTLNAVTDMHPDNLTIHTLAIKNASELKNTLNAYDLPSMSEVSEMVSLGYDCAKRLEMDPYYMYRQKYMNGNLENIGYSTKNHICRYNIDMMEETMSVMAHGAGSMSKVVLHETDRVERIPNPKDFQTYKNKLYIVNEEKKHLFALVDIGNHSSL